MCTPARVLLIGDEPAYMEAHAAVLKHFWTVEMVTLGQCRVGEVKAEVVVVSATIPDRERQLTVERLRMGTPTLLVVKMNGYDSGPFAGADATVDEDHGPGALVSKIYELLTERGYSSRGWPGDLCGCLEVGSA